MENFDSLMIVGVFLQVIWIIPAALQLVVGIYANKNYKGSTSTLILIGGILALVMSIANVFINNFLIHLIGYGENIQYFFYAKSIIDFIAQFIFVFGVFQLLNHIKQGRFSQARKADNPFFID